jgi:hypothetical protein
MIDIFDKNDIDLSNITCHSGGAVGADTYWEEIGKKFRVKTMAYSYKTKSHNSVNKVEISNDDFIEGIEQVNKANLNLKRYGIHKFINLLARNWAQVKYSEQIFAIGTFIKPGEKDSKGYTNKGTIDVVSGGTGYAVMMGIDNQKEVFLFDQVRDNWFRWSYTSNSFVQLKNCPKITKQNFAGIGTREIKQNGIDQIEMVYKLTFSNE